MRRPHCPEILVGFRLSPWSLAIRMETGSNFSRNVEQQVILPQRPSPPVILAWFRIPTCLISIRQPISRTSILTSWRKSTRPSAVKKKVSLLASNVLSTVKRFIFSPSFLDAAQAKDVGFLFGLRVEFDLFEIFRCGQAKHLFQGPASAFRIVRFRRRHDRSETQPLIGFHDHIVSGVQNECAGIEIVYFSGGFESYSYFFHVFIGLPGQARPGSKTDFPKSTASWRWSLRPSALVRQPLIRSSKSCTVRFDAICPSFSDKSAFSILSGRYVKTIRSRNHVFTIFQGFDGVVLVFRQFFPRGASNTPAGCWSRDVNSRTSQFLLATQPVFFRASALAKLPFANIANTKASSSPIPFSCRSASARTLGGTWPKSDMPATGYDSRQKVRSPECDQDQQRPVRRLFENLEQGVGSFGVHAVGLAHDDHPKPGFVGLHDQGLAQFPDLRDLGEPAVGVHPNDVRMVARFELAAGSAKRRRGSDGKTLSPDGGQDVSAEICAARLCPEQLAAMAKICAAVRLPVPSGPVSNRALGMAPLRKSTVRNPAAFSWPIIDPNPDVN